MVILGAVNKKEKVKKGGCCNNVVKVIQPAFVQVIGQPIGFPMSAAAAGGSMHNQDHGSVDIARQGNGAGGESVTHSPHMLWKFLIEKLDLPNYIERLTKPHQEELRGQPKHRHY